MSMNRKTTEIIELRVSPELAAQIRAHAAALNKSEEQFIRGVVAALFDMDSETDAELERSDIEAIFKDAVGYAENWGELETVLSGFELKLVPKGGGLVVRNADGSIELKASSLGLSYSSLIKKFGAAFPGHPHTWLAEKHLGATNGVGDA